MICRTARIWTRWPARGEDEELRSGESSILLEPCLQVMTGLFMDVKWCNMDVKFFLDVEAGAFYGMLILSLGITWK